MALTGNVYGNQATAAAWWMMNGSGTPAFHDSLNCASITDNGVGNYTVNLSITMSSNKNAVVTTADDNGSTTTGYNLGCSAQTTTSCTLLSYRYSSGVVDTDNMYGVVFGDQA